MHRAIAVAGLVLAMGAQSAGAALFLQVPGISGESTTEHYQGWIEVGAFGIAVGRDVISAPSAPDRDTSIPRFSDFEIQGWTSIASPYLFWEAVQGRSKDGVRLDITRYSGPHGNQLVAYWILDGAVLTSYSQSGDGVNRATERYQWDFDQITYGYQEYGKDGSPRGVIEFEWDLRRQTSSMTMTGTVENFQFLTGSLVPEPATAGVMLGVLGLATAQRRRSIL